MKYLKNAYTEKSSSSCWLNFNTKNKDQDCFIDSGCCSNCGSYLCRNVEGEVGHCSFYTNFNGFFIFEVDSTDTLNSEFNLIQKVVMAD